MFPHLQHVSCIYREAQAKRCPPHLESSAVICVLLNRNETAVKQKKDEKVKGAVKFSGYSKGLSHWGPISESPSG